MKQGEIWKINLSPTVGAEIQKMRPAVIINDDSIGVLPLRVIVPVTQWRESFKDALWLVQIKPDTENKLLKKSAIDAFQIRSVSTKRFVKKIGSISPSTLHQIKQAVKAVIDAD